MNNLAHEYKADGGYMIVSAQSTTASWMESHFSTNNYQYMYGFQIAGQFSAIWGTYGNSSATLPYKIVVDRDGYVRFSGQLGAAATCWKQCLGVS